MCNIVIYALNFDLFVCIVSKSFYVCLFQSVQGQDSLQKDSPGKRRDAIDNYGDHPGTNCPGKLPYPIYTIPRQ